MITELVSFRTFFRCLGERRGVEAGGLLAVVGIFFRELTVLATLIKNPIVGQNMTTIML